MRLVIVEQGADCPGPYISPGDCDETVVLRQHDGESPIGLFLRTSARISSLESAGNQVGWAVIAMAPVLEPRVVAARRMLASVILSHVHAAGEESELILAVDQNAALELRRDVMGLVEVLVAHPGSRYTSIRLRFAAPEEGVEPPARKSGIHPCLALRSRDAAL